jgi:hypothetical protein
MTVQTGSHFGVRLQEAKQMVIEKRVTDWQLEFGPMWLRFMLLSKWRCMTLGRLRRRSGTACCKRNGAAPERYRLLLNEWRELQSSAPRFTEIADVRERRKAQSSWRRARISELRKQGKLAYWSQVRDSNDAWWHGG